MRFLYISYLPLVLLVFIFLFFYFHKQEKQFYQWVKENWFYKRSSFSKISFWIFLIALFLLLISLLDLRGPESQISAELPDQKTIILIDTSASMLVEDVRPNRFKKALLLAKHFVKSAVGNQISIVLFSDTQKKLVPFTDDIDLLEARISALESMDIKKGGSNIGQALQESIQYLLSGGDKKLLSGNILVLTDGEENEEEFPINIPDTVSVAFVGVGTLNGGPIPIRDNSGSLMRYKKNGKEIVTSRLNEVFFKNIQSKIKNYHYWIVSSFGLPTDEIISFFKENHGRRFKNGNMRIRPVEMYIIVVPAMILLIISLGLKFFRTFLVLIISFFYVLSPHTLEAAGNENTNEKKSKEVKPKTDPKLEKSIQKYTDILKHGKLGKEQQLDLAYFLLQSGNLESSIALYNEALGDHLELNKFKLEYFNYGSALLENKKLSEGIQLLKLLYLGIQDEGNLEIKTKIRENIIAALNQEQQSKQNSSDKEENKEDKNKKDKQSEKQDKSQSNSDKEQNNKDNNDNSKSSSNQKNEQDKKDKDENQRKENENKENKEKEKNKDDDEKDSDNKNNENENKKNKEIEKEKDKEQQGKHIKKKIPALLKQLLNDDRKVQEKVLDTSTDEKKKGSSYKDW